MEEPLLPPSTSTIAEKSDADAPRAQDEPRRRPYPDPFYCPLTRRVMTDPVVGADGDSFERSAASERDPADDSSGDASHRQQRRAYYPNRALRIVIDKEKLRLEQRGTARGALHRAEEGLCAGLERVMEGAIVPILAAPATPDNRRPLPDAYYCPITLDIMVRPAIDPDGNTYERRAILGWIRTHGTSPMTRNALASEQLRNNNALEALIADEVNRIDDSIHPALRQWKESRNRKECEDDAPRGPPSRGGIDAPEDEEDGRPVPGEGIDRRPPRRLASAVSFVFASAAVVWCAAVFLPPEALLYILCSALIVVLHLAFDEAVRRRAQRSGEYW